MKKLKRLFYNSFKAGESNPDSDNEDHSTDRSTYQGDIKPMIVHSDLLVDKPSSNSQGYDNMKIHIESSTQLYEKFLQKMDTQPYKKISKVVETLPVFQIRESLIQIIQDNSLVIICGETGIQ